MTSNCTSEDSKETTEVKWSDTATQIEAESKLSKLADDIAKLKN